MRVKLKLLFLMKLRSPWKSAMLFYGNYFFTAVFALESVVKIFAMSPRYFFAVSHLHLLSTLTT